ncbi:class I SAM-dependent methyltransferase [Actinomadura parmotrematis]|uniref:Class I SAM-dependent methyltransferase n=1 Tax=Actinomadura parmotrematis TaxID=2864039 RepID=A0ABS7FNW2_9ACTN|nr:class I SAM-dependent methyltransferase [Actinomadura parmotrematis]MBW8481930.1 class I SAM-dependent methyltransferase [Actinomadura parmotrematis]
MENAFPDHDRELVRRRAASFGGSAAAYAAERPGYPAAAVRWALEGAPGPRVLDLGAGTGKLTGELLRGGAGPGDVVAVEPDPEMLAELRRRVPGVRAEAGGAEAIPLPDGSADAVLVGQALHWFDLDRALPEIHRVLAPGGVLAALWNLDDDRVPWVAGFKEQARSSVSWTGWSGNDLPPSRWFPGVERAEFPNAQRRTAASLTATAATHSHILVLDDAERAAVLDRIRAYLRSVPETAEGEFDLPIVTLALRTTRA